MKTATIILILTFLLTGNLYCQVQEQDFYEVLNVLVERYNIESLKRESRQIEIPNPRQHQFIEWCINQAEDKIDSSLVDSTFIVKQTSIFSRLKWEKIKILKKIKITKKATHYFSIPLFLNSRKDIVIVYHAEYYGPLSATGTYEMFQKIDNKWILKTIMLAWIA
jgi:hypothetical protein